MNFAYFVIEVCGLFAVALFIGSFIEYLKSK